MSSRIIIQVLLIAAVGIIGWMMLRSPSGARHQAGRRIVTLAFVIFAFVSIAVPSVVSRIAYFVGVGRGTDLLLYALVIAFLVGFGPLLWYCWWLPTRLMQHHSARG